MITYYIFTDSCRKQNFYPSLLHLVDRLYTVIHKTQKTRTNVFPSAWVGEKYFTDDMGYYHRKYHLKYETI